MRPESVDNSFEERRRRRHEVRVSLGLEEPTLEERVASIEAWAATGDPEGVAALEEVSRLIDELELEVLRQLEQANRLH